MSAKRHWHSVLFTHTALRCGACVNPVRVQRGAERKHPSTAGTFRARHIATRVAMAKQAQAEHRKALGAKLDRGLRPQTLPR